MYNAMRAKNKLMFIKITRNVVSEYHVLSKFAVNFALSLAVAVFTVSRLY